MLVLNVQNSQNGDQSRFLQVELSVKAHAAAWAAERCKILLMLIRASNFILGLMRTLKSQNGDQSKLLQLVPTCHGQGVPRSYT